MQNIFSVSRSELGEVFTQVAFKKGLGLPTIIEKDFWLVKVLKILFSDQEFRQHHVFKGGTSLSKCFGLIQRFSEDVDITISRAFLGFCESNAEISKLGSKKRKRYFDALKTASVEHVQKLSEYLAAVLTDELKNEDWKLYVDSADQEKIIFEYPKALDLSLYPEDAYVKPKILLEFGCRGEVFPTELLMVKTFCEEAFGEVFEGGCIVVNALDPERTFWEKVTLLHMFANQPEDKVLQPQRLRHYYDIYRMAQSEKMPAFMNNLELLESVAEHKTVYFRSKQASYETARLGSLKLVPPQKLRQIQRKYCLEKK